MPMAKAMNAAIIGSADFRKGDDVKELGHHVSSVAGDKNSGKTRESDLAARSS
jgi:hypothetical protein